MKCDFFGHFTHFWSPVCEFNDYSLFEEKHRADSRFIEEWKYKEENKSQNIRVLITYFD